MWVLFQERGEQGALCRCLRSRVRPRDVCRLIRSNVEHVCTYGGVGHAVCVERA